jgi:predicted dehydrogenase
MADGLSIGLVGCGRWGRLILRDLVSLGCRVAVAEHSEEGRAAARAAGAVMAVEHLHDLYGRHDGYVVATQTATHYDVVMGLVGTGRPIYVEKPLTNDPAKAAAVARAAGERVFVMEKWRYHPGVEALAAIARSGELGAVERLCARRLQWGYNHRDVDALWILLPHDISILDEVLGGALEPISARADWHDGAVVGLAAEFARARIESSVRRTAYDRTLELVCEGGVAKLADPYDDHISVVRNDGDPGFHEPAPERRPISTEFPLLRELRAFRDHLVGGPPPKATAAVGLRTVETIAALRRLAGLP